MKVVPILEETMDFLRSSLPSTIDIQCNTDTQTDVIMGDPTKIQQVIMNLCQNAAYALESQKGAMEVGLANIHLEPMSTCHDLPAGRYLQLTVRDTGVGMSPDVLPRIFEPFFTTKDVGQGTGMGLSVVHGIVKSHGGAVTVRSVEGEGSLFTVYLPVCDPQYKDPASFSDSIPSAKGKGKVLLIDDEEIILSSVQRVLKMSGYRVIALKDSLDALKLFEKKPGEFDLVITDQTMPGITGIELSKKLLDIRPDVPVILCTGYNDAICGDEAKSIGIRELLLKPAGTSELKSVVRRALEN
jgi:CheY-like chemotaxis protein